MDMVWSIGLRAVDIIQNRGIRKTADPKISKM